MESMLIFVLIENVDIIEGDDDTTASEFAELDADGNLQGVTLCHGLNGTTAECAVVGVRHKPCRSDLTLPC